MVFALAAIAVLTAVIVIFFSRAQLDMQIAFSSSNLVKADVFARSAADLITDEFRGEIEDSGLSAVSTGSNITSNYNTYTPKLATSMVPVQSGVSSPTGVLVAVSANNAKIWSDSTAFSGSTASTGTASQNGRYLTAARWFTTTSSPQLGGQSTLPTWVLVTRNGVPSTTSTTPLTITTAKDPTQGNYVIGRFAYAVYDTSALPDVNVVGYPATALADVPFKASPAYADLSLLGLNSSQVSNFLSWRNAYTGTNQGTFAQWATGVLSTSSANYNVTTNPSGTVANPSAIAAAKSGHLSIAAAPSPSPSDQPVLSRQDLLANPYVYPSPTPSSPPLFTHFSRSANGPSFVPAVPSNTNPNLADVRWTTSQTVTHYNDDGTTQTYNVTAGDPLLQRRFSLAKLTWITSAGPSATLVNSVGATNAATAIQACFGLQYDSGNARWDYAANDSTYAIKTLSEVATGTTGTEPNLFELLKAGITSGSLGLASAEQTFAMPDQNGTIDPSPDAQILRIGANMIDCQGADNFPTTVALNLGSGVYFPVYGVKDLPYLSALAFGSTCAVTYPAPDHPTDPTWASMQWASLYMVPVLFNPHRSSIPAVPNQPGVTTPERVRIRIVSGINESVYNTGTGGGPSSGTPLARPNINGDLSANQPIVMSYSSLEAFRSMPQGPQGQGTSSAQASSSTMLSTLLAPATVGSAWQSLHGFTYYVYTGLPQSFVQAKVDATQPSGFDKYSVLFRSFPTKFLIVMEYQDASGNWRIYDSMAGNEAFAGTSSGTGIGSNSTTNTTYAMDFTPGAGWDTTVGTTLDITPTKLYQVMKIDPRTTRLGLPKGQSFIVPTLGYSTSTVGTARSFNYTLPFVSQGAPSGQSLFPELWASGNETGWTAATEPSLSTISNVADPDGVVRPADGWLGGSPSYSANLYANLTDQNRRPVILHRPFRSVGELGYVFRDSPWKTLNLFDDAAQTTQLTPSTTGYTSADRALLDIFSVSDEPAVSAGRININGTQPVASPAPTPTQQALLTGSSMFQDGTNQLPGTLPADIAGALSTYAGSSVGPLANVAQLTDFMDYLNTTSTKFPAATYPNKTQRESVVRALAGTSQSRTWNLLIDVVAQTGRYSTNASQLSNFIVDGEKRYWLSIALDRYTGRVISRQLEPVNE